MAAVALAVGYSSATGTSLFAGLAAALDTLSAQAFGARNYPRVGELTQRGLALSVVLLALPVALMWWYGGDMLALEVFRQASHQKCTGIHKQTHITRRIQR
jgi:MATE family multidrug resistance protein